MSVRALLSKATSVPSGEIATFGQGPDKRSQAIGNPNLCAVSSGDHGSTTLVNEVSTVLVDETVEGGAAGTSISLSSPSKTTSAKATSATAAAAMRIGHRRPLIGRVAGSWSTSVTVVVRREPR